MASKSISISKASTVSTGSTESLSNDDVDELESGRRMPRRDALLERAVGCRDVMKSSVQNATVRRSLLANRMFKDLSMSTFDQLAARSEYIEYDPGEIIIKQGDIFIDYFYIIYEGTCKVNIDGKDLPDPYGTLSPGNHFGELGMIYDEPRTATVSAYTNVGLYRISRKAFQEVCNEEVIESEGIKDITEEMKKIDATIDILAGVSTRYGGDVIKPYKPERTWLWRQWRGTVLQYTYKAALFNMVIAAIVTILMRLLIPGTTWAVGAMPDSENPVIARLQAFGSLWGHLMTLTTFILSFFLSQAYSLWRSVYDVSRGIQGRINDTGMILAGAATRDEEGRINSEAEVVLDDFASLTRLFHAFFWASGSKRFSLLLTPQGLSRMLCRGLLTHKQYDALQKIGPNVCEYHWACLEWMTFLGLRAMEDGTIRASEGLRQVFLHKMTELRGFGFTIHDDIDGRMPVTYVHIVQMLTDTFVFSSPFALYATLGVWSIFATGLLTLFYSGLLTLSKMLLDPLDNDGQKDTVNMDIGVLVREGNMGTTRWKNASSALPF